jgi:hypothetical protein
MNNSEIIIVIETPEKQQRAMEMLKKYEHRNITAKDAKDFYGRDIITLDELEELLKKQPK